MARKYLCGTNDNNVVSKMYSKKTKKTFIHKVQQLHLDHDFQKKVQSSDSPPWPAGLP